MRNPDWEECVSGARAINAHYGLREEDLRVIFDQTKDISAGSVIVEVGVCHGRTASVLAYVAKCRDSEYSGVDLFGFDGTTKEGVEESLSKLQLPVTFYQGSSNGQGGKALACPKWGKPIDVLFIDAGHDEVNIKGDCETWLPRLAPKGLVVFDDWNDGAPYSNAHWGIKFYSEMYCKGWDVILTGQKLHIRRKP